MTYRLQQGLIVLDKQGFILNPFHFLFSIYSSRPVKVIRLVAKETAEEIILKRSQAKLSLTHTVIEGGKFSHMTQSHVTGDNSTQLADILKFGLEKIMSSDERYIYIHK